MKKFAKKSILFFGACWLILILCFVLAGHDARSAILFGLVNAIVVQLVSMPVMFFVHYARIDELDWKVPAAGTLVIAALDGACLLAIKGLNLAGDAGMGGALVVLIVLGYSVLFVVGIWLFYFINYQEKRKGPI